MRWVVRSRAVSRHRRCTRNRNRKHALLSPPGAVPTLFVVNRGLYVDMHRNRAADILRCSGTEHYIIYVHLYLYPACRRCCPFSFPFLLPLARELGLSFLLCSSYRGYIVVPALVTTLVQHSTAQRTAYQKILQPPTLPHSPRSPPPTSATTINSIIALTLTSPPLPFPPGLPTSLPAVQPSRHNSSKETIVLFPLYFSSYNGEPMEKQQLFGPSLRTGGNV